MCLLLAELRVNLLYLGTVLVAIERRGNARAQLLHKLLHIALERAAAAQWQAQRAWFVRLFEVVDVTPVRGVFLPSRARFEEMTQHTMLAGARRP